jgi:hypothetical protein
VDKGERVHRFLSAAYTSPNLSNHPAESKIGDCFVDSLLAMTNLPVASIVIDGHQSSLIPHSANRFFSFHFSSQSAIRNKKLPHSEIRIPH